MSSSRAQGRVGRVLREKWHLDRLLGAGGMACVYAATHRNGTRAAVKLLHPELSLNDDIKQRFLREGYLANSVDHPGIVRVFDDDVDTDGSVYLVMDLLSGETLENKWRKAGKQMQLDEALRVGISVLDVLAAAHAKGIVHRDIKPENIFLTTNGGLRVLDFGIARVREAQQNNATQTGALLGTPSYMSPEQAKGQWREVDHRADIWAVGATLFTLLAGRPPHTGEGGNEVLLKAMTQPAPRLASIAPHIPPAVCDVVDRALAFDRDMRWPDARTMQQALQQATVFVGYAPTMLLSDARSQVSSLPQPTESGVAKTLGGSTVGPQPRKWLLPAVLGGCLVAGGGLSLTAIGVYRTMHRPSASASVVPVDPQLPDASTTPPPPVSIASVSATPIPASSPVKSATSPTSVVIHRPPPSAVSSAGRPAPSVGTTDIHDSRR